MPTKKNNIPTGGFIRNQDADRKQEILDLFIKETNEYGVPNYNPTTDFPSPIYEKAYQQALDYQIDMLNSPRGQEMLRKETARNFLFNRDKRNEKAFQKTYDARLRNLENARSSLLFAPEIAGTAYGMAFPDGENTVVLTQELRGIPYTVPNMYNPDDLMFTMVHEADHVEKGSDYNTEGSNFFDANLQPKAFEKVRLTQRKTKDALENLDAQFGGGYQRQTGMTKEDFLSNYKNKKKGEKAYYFGEKNPDKNVEGHIPLVELYDFDWASSPDEVSSQIVELQFLSSRAGIYDPKTEEFNESHLKKLEQLVNSKQVPQTVFRTFKNLKGIYEDNNLIDIMNLISQNNSRTDRTNMTYAQNGGFTVNQDVPATVDLRYMPTDYMSGFSPNAMTQSGQTNNPRLFRGNATGFPLKAGTEGANPELYIAAADAKFSPQSLYRTGQAIMPSFGVRGDVAYDRSLTPEVREDIFRYTGRNISPFNTRFNPYIEVSGPRGNTVTGGVSFGGQVTPGGQSGLSYNVGYRKTFAEGGYSRHRPGNYFVEDPDGTAQVSTGRGFYADRVLQDDAIGLGEYAAPNPGGGGFVEEVTKNLTQPEIVRGGITKEEVQKKVDSRL